MPAKRNPRRERTPPPDLGSLGSTMEAILGRLSALEQRSSSEAPSTSTSCPVLDCETGASASGAVVPTDASPALSCGASLHGSRSGTPSQPTGDLTERLIDALKSINPVRPSHYYVSDFDPSVHDVNAWCDEVDRARTVNRWDEKECLSRVGLCLRGEARVWLREWAATDRTWSNFKLELKSLCPRRVDVANILFDVMCTVSDKYPTYAEYARRSLLRLRIVRGLSDELISAIIVRGITDPHIRAAACNAKLTPENIVEFLSIYVKPNSSRTQSNSRNNIRQFSNNSRLPPNSNRKRSAIAVDSENRTHIRCYFCEQRGHKSAHCPKKSKSTSEGSTNDNKSKPARDRFVADSKNRCTFCKKSGHSQDECFAKERSESRNKANVNFCKEIKKMQSDVITAVLCGIPTDVLIDSGSCVSLISSDLLKHFPCKLNPSYQILRGLGGTNVQSNSYVTLPIEFNNLTLEVDFYVVPHECLSTPVIVGTDVLNRNGITYIRTGDSQRITRDNVFVNNISLQQIKRNTNFECINTTLYGEDKDRLVAMLGKYSEYFLSGTATTTVTTGEMHIRLTSDIPVYYRPYKLSHDEKLRVRGIVRDLLDKGIIRESESSYASPILLVKKKDGSDRMVVDYRALNSITIKDRYPLPLIEDLVDRLGDAKFFTTLDMLTGFHQIRLSEESVDKTAFVTPEGHYEYVKMPYGLANAPVIYQRIISETLKSSIESGKVLVYIDDVLLMSNSVNEGLSLLDSVLKTLTGAGFSINLQKCTFLATEVEYLGRTISNGQVRPSPSKIKALVQSPIPKNVKQVRQFLGLAGYFRRYIPGYATTVAPIASLTRKNVSFHWGELQERARQDIIEKLTNEPVLSIFDPNLDIEVHTDASSLGYGAVLLQVHSDGRKNVVAYYSKVTVGAEPKYHSYELETLAVVKALQNFRHYLIGKHFKVVTDCNALKMTQRKKDLQPRVARWWIYLQDFDFTLEYRKGACMGHADYLSRNPVNLCAVKRPTNWAQVAQAADDETSTLLEKLNNGQLDDSRYIKKNDLLYYKYDAVGSPSRFLCYVPKAYRLSLLRVFHDEHEHIGIDKTLDLILKHFWFPGMRQFVRKYIAHCITCITHKKIPRAPLQPITSWQKPSIPFDTVHIDVLGPLPDSMGHKYVLIMVDAFTKFCLLYPIYRQDSNELKRVFTNAISIFGTPRLLVCDRGRMFESIDFTNWVSQFGINLHFITPEMHQSNGQVERYCRTVLNMIRVEVNHKSELWSNVLWKLQLVLNITKQKTTQTSALNLLIGSESTTPAIQALVKDITMEGANPNREAWRELQRQRAATLLSSNQAKQDSRENKNRCPPKTFSLNDFAYVIKRSQSVGKLDSGMRGPYRVTKVLPSGRYELQLVAGSYGKTTQAAAEYMLPWNGEWTPDTCAAFFESDEDECTSQEGREDAAPSGTAVLAASPSTVTGVGEESTSPDTEPI